MDAAPDIACPVWAPGL